MNIFSNKSEKYYKSGFDKFRNEDLEGALLDQNKAIELDNNNYRAYHQRATIKVNQKKYYEAIKDLEVALKLNPNGKDYYVEIGYVYIQLKDKISAKKYFEKAHLLGDPNGKIALNYYFRNDKPTKNKISKENLLFLEKNPPNIMNDEFMKHVYSEICKVLPLKNVFFGYNLITEKFFNDAKHSLTGNSATIGLTSSLGFDDLDYIKELYNEIKYLYLFYIAIPIDDEDYIIENNMLDFDFAFELEEIVKRDVSTIGSLSYNEFKRCRTFKWFDGFDYLPEDLEQVNYYE